MKRTLSKRWLWLCLLLLAIFSLVVFPVSRWRIIGWVKGEAFYEGWPTSYWAHELQQWGHPSYAIISSATVISRSGPFWCRQPSAWERLWKQVQPAPMTRSSQPPLVEDRDPASIPVLLELLQHPDSGIQLIVVHALGQIGPDAHQAVPALLRMIEEADKPLQEYQATGSFDLSSWIDQGAVWEEAANALKKIAPEAAANAGVK
jgi:hypothetical protein